MFVKRECRVKARFFANSKDTQKNCSTTINYAIKYKILSILFIHLNRNNPNGDTTFSMLTQNQLFKFANLY